MKEIERILRTYCYNHPSSWFKYIGRMERTINGTVHSSTKAAPVELERKAPRLLPLEFGNERITKTPLQEKIKLAYSNLLKSAKKRNKYHASKKQSVTYKVGQLVLLHHHEVSSKLKKITSKLCLLYYGPFTISKITRKNAYELKKETEKS